MKKIKRGVWQLKCWWWGTSSNYRGMLRSPGNVLITLFLSSKLPPSPLFVLLQCSAFAFYLWQWKIGISWLAFFCQNFQFCINEMRSGKRHRGKVIKTQCGEYNEMVHTNSLSKDWTTGRVRKYIDSLSTTAFFFQILMVENVRWGSKPQPPTSLCRFVCGDVSPARDTPHHQQVRSIHCTVSILRAMAGCPWSPVYGSLPL